MSNTAIEVTTTLTVVTRNNTYFVAFHDAVTATVTCLTGEYAGDTVYGTVDFSGNRLSVYMIPEWDLLLRTSRIKLTAGTEGVKIR